MNNKPNNITKKKRFDSFMDNEPVNPWNQTLIIMKESITIEQSKTCSIFVSYDGDAPEILALMAALSGIYRGYSEKVGRWYFHSQLVPCLRIAMLALQDKAPCQLVEDILSSER